MFEPDNLYQWRKGFRSYGVDPAQAARELRYLESQDGVVTPQAVLARAAEPTNVLHRLFEWDDTEAAHEYRIEQARGLLRSITIRRVAQPAGTEPTRVYVRLYERDAPALSSSEEEALEPGNYLTVSRVMADENLRRRYVRQALQEALSWRQRYREIHEFASIFERIDAVKAELEPQPVAV